MRIFTIGFTEKKAERFFSLIKLSGTKRVVDVRLNNISQLSGFAKRDDLKYFLKELCDVDYVHLPELAPTKEILSPYQKKEISWLQYEDKFLNLMAKRNIEKHVKPEIIDEGCLLCSEHQPHQCHRRLVANYLKQAWDQSRCGCQRFNMSKNAKVLIAYPIDFLSYSKFERKVDKIISSLEEVELIFVSDENSFIEKYSQSKGLPAIPFSSDKEALKKVTHAILFQDEERNCFYLLHNELLDKEIPTRVINLKVTKVSNKDMGDSYDVYIGRGTLWGNPYQMGKEGTRDEVIAKFAYDFDKRFLKLPEKFDENIEKLRGKTLGCHCKPAACHGDVIANYLNSQDDGK